MYIKLTRFDNSPIWLNAAFVVTIEPRKGGGAIVVPIGDGLDYEVRETPEDVLALLDGTPPATVVPVPAPKTLTATPADVSPETEPPETVSPATPPAAAPAKRGRRTKKNEADAAEPKPVRKPRAKAKTPEAALSAEQVERLKKMMPGSVRKLLNTLATQFKVADAEAAADFLRSQGLIEVDRERVIWKQDSAEKQ